MPEPIQTPTEPGNASERPDAGQRGDLYAGSTDSVYVHDAVNGMWTAFDRSDGDDLYEDELPADVLPLHGITHNIYDVREIDRLRAKIADVEAIAGRLALDLTHRDDRIATAERNWYTLSHIVGAIEDDPAEDVFELARKVVAAADRAASWWEAAKRYARDSRRVRRQIDRQVASVAESMANTGLARARADAAEGNAKFWETRATNAAARADAAEAKLRDAEKIRFEVEKILDDALGPNEEDGAGLGLAGDVAMLAERKKATEAKLAEVQAERDDWAEKATAAASVYDEVTKRVPAIAAERDEARVKLDQIGEVIDHPIMASDEKIGAVSVILRAERTTTGGDRG